MGAGSDRAVSEITWGLDSRAIGLGCTGPDIDGDWLRWGWVLDWGWIKQGWSIWQLDGMGPGLDWIWGLELELGFHNPMAYIIRDLGLGVTGVGLYLRGLGCIGLCYMGVGIDGTGISGVGVHKVESSMRLLSTGIGTDRLGVYLVLCMRIQRGWAVWGWFVEGGGIKHGLDWIGREKKMARARR